MATTPFYTASAYLTALERRDVRRLTAIEQLVDAIVWNIRGEIDVLPLVIFFGVRR